MAGPIVATLYGIGAFWLTSALVGGAISVLFMFVGRPQVQLDPVVRQELPVREMVAILAALVGVAVTRASGGWRAVGLLAAVFAVTEAGSYGLQTWRCTHLSEIMPLDFCPTPGRSVGADVPRVAGGIVGLLVAPLVFARPRPRSPLLVAAVVISIASVAMQIATTPFTPVSSEAAMRLGLVLQAVDLLVWLAVGVIAGRLGGGVGTLAVLALTIVFPAAFGMRLAIVQPVTDETMRLWQIDSAAVNVAFAGALIIGWVLTRTQWRDPDRASEPDADTRERGIGSRSTGTRDAGSARDSKGRS